MRRLTFRRTSSENSVSAFRSSHDLNKPDGIHRGVRTFEGASPCYPREKTIPKITPPEHYPVPGSASGTEVCGPGVYRELEGPVEVYSVVAFHFSIITLKRCVLQTLRLVT